MSREDRVQSAESAEHRCHVVEEAQAYSPFSLSSTPLSLSLPPLIAVRKRYVGHYILLVAHDAAANEFVYFDPSQRKGPALQRISTGQFELAHTAPGTDRDMILIRYERDDQ